MSRMLSMAVPLKKLFVGIDLTPEGSANTNPSKTEQKVMLTRSEKVVSGRRQALDLFAVVSATGDWFFQH